MPPVVGLTVAEARERLAECGLIAPPSVYYENSAERAEARDKVVAVSPPEGARVPKGVTVLLIAGRPADALSREKPGNSTGPQAEPEKASNSPSKKTVPMPTVIGFTVKQAKEALSKQGFTRITVTAAQAGPDEGQMQVWSTQPDPGEICTLDQEVLIFAKIPSSESRTPPPAPTPSPPGPGGRSEPEKPPKQEPQRKPEDPMKAIESILRILQIFRRPW
ncbi:MAG: PASTA domain-containing protein [Armatimonadetes bacterium]|nr:PASTA domain-containing protein [Armatimonadota bacterium]